MDYAKALAIIGPFEGRIPWMYLDVNGYVTAGVGNLLATPQVAIALIWRRRDEGGEADEVEIGDEWMRVHGAVKGRAAGAYKPLTRLELADHEIGRLFNRRVDEFCTQLEHHFPLWPEWPEEAQLATLDMAFNLGAGALPKEWPKLSQALRAMDWRQAAVDCHRPQSHEARNVAVKALFAKAAQEQGAVPTKELA